MNEYRKTAIVTGAAKGIGSTIAYEMGVAGYDVIVNYHNDKTEADKLCKRISELGVRAIPIYADISKVNDIHMLVDRSIQAFEHIDVLINNAGISSEVYFIDATEAMFDSMISVDWKGLFFCSQFVAKHMIEKKINGVIINISSNQVNGCWPRATIYGPAKAAVEKFTKNAAMELSLSGIRMVAVAPGYTDVGWEPDDIRMKAAEKLPLKRFASTKEIAKGVVYLASEDANYIVGSTLTIDGGATLPVVAANDFVKD